MSIVIFTAFWAVWHFWWQICKTKWFLSSFHFYVRCTKSRSYINQNWKSRITPAVLSAVTNRITFFVHSLTTDHESLAAVSTAGAAAYLQQRRRRRGPLLYRVLRTALPLQLLLLLLLGIACIVPLCEDDYSCLLVNNLRHSFSPMLRYTNGAPPT